MEAAKTLRLIQRVLMGSIVLYVVLGETVSPKRSFSDPTLDYVLSTIAVALVGIIFVVRRTLVLRAEESLAHSAEDRLSLEHWKTGFITTYALCEALALFGLVLRFAGYNLQQSLEFYLGGFVLLAFFSPRLRTSTS